MSRVENNLHTNKGKGGVKKNEKEQKSEEDAERRGSIKPYVGSRDVPSVPKLCFIMQTLQKELVEWTKNTEIGADLSRKLWECRVLAGI